MIAGSSSNDTIDFLKPTFLGFVISQMTSTSYYRPITLWLLSGCFLIFCMVVIGGITRLTGSGLSITEWNVIMGTLPPLNDQEWQVAFEKYQQIPQFTEVNSHFGLEDFKGIFWWEYIHRLVGRMIGIVFIVPFLYFLIRRKLDAVTLRKAVFLFLLGGLQGFLGWFMVKSGLSERTSVSHIRLAIHLTTAFVTFGFTFWFALQSMKSRTSAYQDVRVRAWLKVLLWVVVVQLIYGAFVAGLHAGKMFNSFPLMNGAVIPETIWIPSFGSGNLTDNPATVQFIHRFLAFAITFIVAVVFLQVIRSTADREQKSAIYFLAGALSLQIALGIFTILYHAPLMLSSIHQIGAFFLFSAVLISLHRFRATGY